MNGGDEEIEVTIAVGDAHLSAMSQVVEGLRAAGLTVEEESSQTGTIVGRIEASRATALSEVPGVLRVEPARRFRLPRPDSDVQ